jgi:hypothetical protein
MESQEVEHHSVSIDFVVNIFSYFKRKADDSERQVAEQFLKYIA